MDPEPAFPNGGQVQLENLVIDLDRGEVRQDDRLVSVTPVERACLVALSANPGRVLTREAMLRLVYDDDPRIDINSRALDVHLSHVRQKLGRPAWLTSVTGIGFRVVTPETVGESPSVSIESVRMQRREQRRAWARDTYGSQPPRPNTHHRPDNWAPTRPSERFGWGGLKDCVIPALGRTALDFSEYSWPPGGRIRVEVVDLKPPALAEVHHFDRD